MDRISMENMIKIIEEHKIEIDREINGDFFCIICQNIMIDACNGPCGCRYCRKCITEYLINEKRECPGQTVDCNSQSIDIDTDICKDQAINIKISRLIVLCPNLDCKSKLELRSIENHLRICEKRSISCPFTSIGCVEDKLRFDKVDEHLASDALSHSQLLINWINISMNDKELTKKDLETLKSENIDLKHKIKLTEEENKSLLTKNEVQCIIIEQIQQNLINKNKEQDKIVEEIKESIRKDLEILKEESIYLREKIKLSEAQNQDFELRLEKLSLENQSLKESIIESRFLEFVWIIDEWSEKLKQAQNGIDEVICSDEFFSHKNGYKMELELYPNGYEKSKEKYLSVFFCIKKGPFDNILQWPFKFDVEIALMNQSTGLPHHTIILDYDENYKSCFDKPINEDNEGYGNSQFIEISEILNNAGLIENDQIIIKWAVKQ